MPDHVRYPFTVSDSSPRLRLPLQVRLCGESVSICDAEGTSVCYVYFDDEGGVRRRVRRRLSKEDAIAVARIIARALPDAATLSTA